MRVDQPLVTVLMPAYNASATIARAVGSALDQALDELEVVVVDDGSDVPVDAALEEIRDDRLRVVRLERNRGVSAARNTALRLARAPLVAQLDADDSWHQNHLASLLPAFADPIVGLAYGNAEVIGHPAGRDRWLELPGNGAPPRSVTGPREHPVNELGVLYRGNPIPAVATVLRTEAARAVGGYPEWLGVGEDYLLYLRLRRAGWRFAYVDKVTATYHWPSPGRGATFNRRRNAREQTKLFAVLALSSPPHPAILGRLGGELRNVAETHVPGALAAARLVRRLLRWRPLRRQAHGRH
jgi:GT2 family glycosyltransferase